MKKRTYEINVTFTVRELSSKQDAIDFGGSLADHVLDTFNDDGSIDSLVDVRVRVNA